MNIPEPRTWVVVHAMCLGAAIATTVNLFIDWFGGRQIGLFVVIGAMICLTSSAATWFNFRTLGAHE